ncbi:MAG: DNA-3-methyladenine glycosylase I, partial [Chitinispirillia bacterium]
DGAQAGLSWITILKKRDGYRKAFDNFNAEKIASYSDEKVSELLQNPNIIRNRLKIKAAIKNAQCYLDIMEQYDSFDSYIWQFTDGRTKQNAWKHISEIPPNTEESDSMSRDLKKRGFKFVGTTICYAFMQASGMVNDHVTYCFRYEPLKNLK